MNQFMITPRQVMAQLARGQHITFVDARPDTRCAVPGAVRLDRAAVADASSLVVVYGERGWELQPLAVAHELCARGYTRVRILAGGLLAWEAARPATSAARS